MNICSNQANQTVLSWGGINVEQNRSHVVGIFFTFNPWLSHFFVTKNALSFPFIYVVLCSIAIILHFIRFAGRQTEWQKENRNIKILLEVTSINAEM